MPYSGTIISEQYPATDETQCINLIIPAGDEFKALAYGLLNKATIPGSYDDPDSVQTEGLCAVWDNALYLTDWNACMENTQSANNSLLLTGDDFEVDDGGANTWTVNGNQPMGGYWRQNPANSGDMMDAYRFMVAGDWSYRLISAKQTFNGKLLLQINDADGNIITEPEVDLYGSAVPFVITGTFTLAVSGYTRLHIGNNGRNASSTGYFLPVSLLSLWRTG